MPGGHGGIGDDKNPASRKTDSNNTDCKSRSTELTHSDYTVGWLCALSKEQTAATGMLDQIHSPLPKPSNDPNAYTLGSIGKHNIVIACLPKGKYGTNSASMVATWMVNTFPSIKVGLMVGIGGGIPPKVRLGDVVVSAPVDQFPGVVQWDMGKAEGCDNFKRTGALNNPPSALLTALTKLETQHEMHGSKIHDYLDDLGGKYPRLASKYTGSDALKDPLFTPEISHRPRSRWQVILSILLEKILALLGCLLGWWVFAPMDRGVEQVASTAHVELSRTRSRPGNTRVHYGLIASGNQVVKDAEFRNRLDESLSGNVLCVEMEAAGLMNDFPCIVIRGICDYADSQKNKDWQEYAAAVAAAYAKELLEYVQTSDVDGERPVKDILGQG
jgi:nucleoside phosphorylase